VSRALIKGVTGQGCLYLSELLLDKGCDVFGLVRAQNNPKFDLVRQVVPDVQPLTGDLTDLSSLSKALCASQPNEVDNISAISLVAYSWENAKSTSDVTGHGVLNMLEATRVRAGVDADRIRFYQASSSEMFGKVQQVPQSETTLLGDARPTEWPKHSGTTGQSTTARPTACMP
jgi:GDPmannose 4,6-dehydratase